MTYGPTLAISEEVHKDKYRGPGESFEDAMTRISQGLSDNDSHYYRLRDVLLDMRFLPAGRVQAAIGSPRRTTAYNCFVSGTIADTMEDIMDKAKEAAQTMRLGGGIGYDFSTLRPRGHLIRSLSSHSSGPVSFMDIYNSVCGTISSAGHRRGAQMGVLRVDHPDIEEFINAKTNSNKLTNFNVSVGVTDTFMEALKSGKDFDLVFEGRTHRSVSARALWDQIMRNTWDWAEPGVLYIDRMNAKNNLWYCEDIAATNPCGEQPLPPYGACLLGSFNLVKYVDQDNQVFLWDKLRNDIKDVVRGMDNVVDRTVYPLEQQEDEAKCKRRMGLGVTGLANALEMLGFPYGSNGFISFMCDILRHIRDNAYSVGIDLAIEKGPFPMWDPEAYSKGNFIRTLPQDIQDSIHANGIRNSHYLSIAPTGTISLTADNISSGLEPVFAHKYDRTIIMPDGTRVEEVKDYGYAKGIKGRTADQVAAGEHVAVLTAASKLVDSACSKTVNVGSDVSWQSFKDLYVQAYDGGASGCTTFRAAGKRYGILNAKPLSEEEQGAACFYDPETGKKQCD